jgi:hypothetical protein
MPGLLRGVARTAVVAGTATAVSNRVSRRQANRWATQEPQYPPQQQAYPPQDAPPPRYESEPYAPPPAAAPVQDDMDAKLAQLKELGQLKEAGVLTDAEFEVQKSRILHGG